MAIRLVTFVALCVIGYDAHPSYSAATDVSYSSVSAPVVSHAASPVYAKLAAPVYATPTYKVAAPVTYGSSYSKAEEYAPAQYQFGYVVNDPHTGDSKSQEEHREGDVVKGSYSLIEADGSKRIVEYTADAHNGFNAVVHNEPGKGSPVLAKVAAPVAYAAPSLSHAYAAPAVSHGYAAPVLSRGYGSPSVAKVSYSEAPAVSYSSVSAPVGHQAYSAPSYYH